MTEITEKYKKEALYVFQVRDLFGKDNFNAFLDRCQLIEKYPEFYNAWNSSDQLESERALFPPELLLALSQQYPCAGEFFVDPDGQTLHIVPHGKKLTRCYENDAGEMVIEEILGATKISTYQAITDFGADAVWLAQEYGKSRRGEREDKYRWAIG